MTFVVKDRVRETSTTTGTGSFTLSGAVQGFQSFSVIGDSNTTFYAIVNTQAGQWEVGIGTYTSATTSLSRDTVLDSSNSGALVNFSAGEKDVFVTYPAEKALYINDVGSAIINNLSLATNEITSTEASDNILITPTGIGALKVQNRITLEDRLSFGPTDPQGSYFANNAEYLQSGFLSAWQYIQNGTATKVEFDNGGAMVISNAPSGNAGDFILAWDEVLNVSSSGDIVTGNWTAGVIAAEYGGTGLSNVGATLDITGNASISGVNTGDQTDITGNAGTATKLQTARTINGVAFDGSANITIATPNNLTIASPLTGGSFNGSAPATIGLPTANSTVTGALSSTDWATFNAKQAALSGAGIVKSTNGTISYLTDNSTNWNTAYNRSLTSAAVTGTTTKTLTLNQQGGTNITASWSDLNTDAVTSVFGRTGAVVATEGDYSLTQLSDVNLTSPTNGQLLQNNGTQWVNWTPNYLTSNQVVTLSGDVTGTGATAITATLVNTTVTAGTYGNATQVPQITVDSKGRATSAGNVTITPAWSSVTGKPTTISGYGITDGVTLTGTQTLTNKTVTDATFTIQDDADNTKKAQFQASGITTATTRTYTLPNDDGKIVITNSGNTENNIPKFNNDDKLVASNISDNGILVNIGPYAVFNTGGISVLSYISTYSVEILGATLGNFGETNFYGAVSAPTLYSNDAISQSTVIVNPKIPYCVNGTNGYIGTYSGANIQFASDTTAVNFWGLGVGTNGVGTDTFSIGRNNTQILTIDNAGAITTSINTTAQITTTQANNAGTGLGQIYLNGATGNRIDFNTNGAGAPTFTTRSVGAKIVLYPGVSASASDYALGIASSTLWYGVPLTTDQHQFYAGTTSIARIRSQGIQTRGRIYEGNTAFSAQNAGTTLTISQILTSVIESAPAANITFTLPTGTNTDAGVMSSLETFASFTWSVVNTSTGFTITMAGNTGNTYIGNTTIAANTSATFRTQKTAANTFKTVRI